MRAPTSLLLLAILLGSVAARAQEAVLQPSAALKCLTSVTGERQALAYPPLMLERKEEGTVAIELEFRAPDAAPAIKVLNEQVTLDDFEYAVRRHVASFRVPCMKAGDPPVKLRQEYVFIPNDGRKVMSSQPRDQADIERRGYWKCLSHVRGEAKPDYPPAARREDVEGNVYVRLRFTSPDRPPEVEILASSHRRLSQAIESYAEDLRLPCLKGEAAEWRTLYRYKLDGGRRTVLNDIGLVKFLGAVQRPVPPAYFDFNGMGCPFDLRITPMQPYSRNGVGELENVNPARQPFKDWLAGLTLNLSEKDRIAVLGDSMTVSVPCGKLDL